MSRGILKGWLITLLFLGYPLIIYLLLTNDLPWLGSAVVLTILIWKIHTRSDWYWWVAGIGLFCALVIWGFGPGMISKLSPILIHSGLFYIFWNSLKDVPLIEVFARLDFPELPPEIVVYTRQLTIFWALFFALNILLCVWMAIWQDDALWALYNGLLVYLLIVILMIGEYLWRHIRFPDLEIPSLRQTAENVIKNGHKIWQR